MHPMLNIAIRAARTTGDLIQRSSRNIEQLTHNKKQDIDYATEISLAAEQEIINVIKNAYPDHSFIANVSGETKGNQYTWLIEALDGSTNLLHGYPQYATSIALLNKNKIEVAVVYDPLKDEVYTAEKGGGAMLNNRRIRVSKQINLNNALLNICFPSGAAQYLDAYLSMYNTLMTNSAGIRSTGSVALELAYLSAGRLDGMCGIAVTKCNIAAGILLVKEAGGVITDFSFNGHYLKSGNFISGNPKMHQALYQAIEPYVSEQLK
jgi:myo-inositol-1(or 4)-monophosphatase